MERQGAKRIKSSQRSSNKQHTMNSRSFSSEISFHALLPKSSHLEIYSAPGQHDESCHCSRSPWAIPEAPLGHSVSSRSATGCVPLLMGRVLDGNRAHESVDQPAHKRTALRLRSWNWSRGGCVPVQREAAVSEALHIAR